MSKELTERQKEIQVLRGIKKYLKDNLEYKMINFVKNNLDKENLYELTLNQFLKK